MELKAGDYVVHEQHGIGRFLEMRQRTIGAGANQTTREYLVIEYASSKRGAPADKLFIPTDQLDQVSKYIGADAPKLNKLGGSDWAATKAKARKHVHEIAEDLVKLYSARQRMQGYAFSKDTPWQKELEDAFPYQETADQLTTIDEVKSDMEKPVPMDRLICGDVGFGKTEIAVRAAFKAVQDSKQVAVLVPTTLLVQQHFETFTERFEGFPVEVRAMSRFQTTKEINDTIEGLEDGSVDVVIGTHKLLGPKVKFKDLGLVIIDEEQRFGVEHKETLKALRTNVDVLICRRHRFRERWRWPLQAFVKCPRWPRLLKTACRCLPTLARMRMLRSLLRSGVSCCAVARCSTCTTECKTSLRLPRRFTSWCRNRMSASPMARWGRSSLTV